MKRMHLLHTRTQAIQEIIKNHPIEDHAMLIELLQEKYGITTNQAAISRDLRKLGVVKRARGEHLIYELPEHDPITEILYYSIESIEYNESMIVVKTLNGTAAMVGDFIDSHNSSLILATLAGENVVFITPRSIKKIMAVVLELKKLLKIKD